MRKFILYSSILIAPVMANAACPQDKAEIFSCTTAAGKSIEVCQNGNQVEYSYGKPGGRPEIVINQPKRSLELWVANELISKDSYTTLAIPNGKTRYIVYDSVSANATKHESGVNVEINGQQVSSVQCDGKNTIVNFNRLGM